MKLFVISFFLLVNLFISFSVNATERLHLPNNEKVDEFIINFGFFHNGKFFFENRLFHCPPETEFPKYPLDPLDPRLSILSSVLGFSINKKERDMALKQYEKEKNLFKEFSNKTCQEQAPKIREGDDNFSRTMRRYFISTCMDFVRYCNNGSFHVYTNNEIDAAIKMIEKGITHNAEQLKHQKEILVDDLKKINRSEHKIHAAIEILEERITHNAEQINQHENEIYKHEEEIYDNYVTIEDLEEGITHNAEQIKHQEKALVKNINNLKATVRSEVENDLIPQFSILMDKIADLEAKINQLEQENRKKEVEMTILKEAVAKENAPQ